MNIGGQAVIEGVMIRNKEKLAIAVRLSDGRIKVKKMRTTYFPAFFNVFFIRGIVGLGFTLYDGLKGLLWSSNQQLGKEEKLNKKEGYAGCRGLFFICFTVFCSLPFLGAYLLYSDGVLFNLLDGGFRIALFLGFLGIVSRMKDVQRLFAYHGAEHKAIYCYESGEEMTVKNALSFSRFHPRCGTSFLFLVLLVSIVLFSLVEGPWWVKLSGRILLLPVIGGISYEIIKLTARFQDNSLLCWLVAPGMWLQRLTTREPSKKQLEVGIAAVKAVLD